MRTCFSVSAAVLCLAAATLTDPPRCLAAAVTNPSPGECFFQPDNTDQQLVARIRLAVRALDDASLTEFEKICAVRHWLSQFIPGADTASGLDLPARFGVDHNSATTAQMLCWCERRLAGMQCGGASVLAYRVFRLLGYEAVVLNVGNAAAGISHVTTLVKLTDPANPAWTVQDASYDFTILDARGRALDYRQLLELLAGGRHDECHLAQPADARFVALYPKAVDPRKIESLAVYVPELLQSYDGYAAYRIRTNFHDNFARVPRLATLLQDRFHDPDPTMIFLLPFGCSGEKVAVDLVHYAQDLRKQHLTLGGF